VLVSKPASQALQKIRSNYEKLLIHWRKNFSRAFLPLIAAVVLVATGARAGLTLINLGSQNKT
jgi:hypothetical protein